MRIVWTGGLVMIAARIRFNKTGNARFISHLDLSRCMARALRRAQIPVWYTQGFNPHPHMVFALPLSLGFESRCEAMDIKLDVDMDGEKIKELLKKELPEDLLITGVFEPVMKIADIGFAEYDIAIYTVGSAEELRQHAEAVRSMSEIIVEKTTKSGTRDVDIKEVFDQADFQFKDGEIKIHAVLPAGSTLNINPESFADAFKRHGSIEIAYQRVMRLSILNKNGEEFK